MSYGFVPEDARSSKPGCCVGDRHAATIEQLDAVVKEGVDMSSRDWLSPGLAASMRALLIHELKECENAVCVS